MKRALLNTVIMQLNILGLNFQKIINNYFMSYSLLFILLYKILEIQHTTHSLLAKFIKNIYYENWERGTWGCRDPALRSLSFPKLNSPLNKQSKIQSVKFMMVENKIPAKYIYTNYCCLSNAMDYTKSRKWDLCDCFLYCIPGANGVQFDCNSKEKAANDIVKWAHYIAGLSGCCVPAASTGRGRISSLCWDVVVGGPWMAVVWNILFPLADLTLALGPWLECWFGQVGLWSSSSSLLAVFRALG